MVGVFYLPRPVLTTPTHARVIRSCKPIPCLRQDGLIASTSVSTLLFLLHLPRSYGHLWSAMALTMLTSTSLPFHKVVSMCLHHHCGTFGVLVAPPSTPPIWPPDHNYTKLNYLQHGFFDDADPSAWIPQQWHKGLSSSRALYWFLLQSQHLYWNITTTVGMLALGSYFSLIIYDAPITTTGDVRVYLVV